MGEWTPHQETDFVIERVGIGTDLHRLTPGGPLRLGGVTVPFDQHLLGHSDADVVLHAVTDAVLGAAGLPDIGELFPNTDPRLLGADSREFVQAAVVAAAERGCAVVNVDIVIHAEEPKLNGHKELIRQAVAALTGVEPNRIGIKAKTNEGLDAVGRGEAIACTCIVGMGRRATVIPAETVTKRESK